MSLSRSPKQYTGVRPINPPNVIYADRSPVSTDTAYVKGDLWEDLTGLTVWSYAGGGVWIALGTGATGGITTLTGGSGGPISPSAGNISLLGTANQITSTGSGGGHSITFSIPATFIAPGSIASTTTITSGTSLVATTSLLVGTTITATAGDITATLGNVVINGAAKQLRVHGGAATDFVGSATLSSGTVTVLNTNIAATDQIYITRKSVNGSTTLGELTYTISGATSFTITSVILGTPASTQTADTSVVSYFIVRQV